MELAIGPNDLEVNFKFTIPADIYEIVLYLSGGLDSATLLCLILTELKNTQRLGQTNIKCVTVVKNDGSMQYSTDIVKHISLLFNKEIEHVNNCVNDEDSITKGRVGVYAIKEIWKRSGPNTKSYMAVNKMAPSDIRPFRQELLVVYKESPYYDSPFLNLHKPQILDILFKLNCESVIPYTHTCTVIVEGRCNQCYSCAERSWAFSLLGKQDPSIN